MGDFVTNLGNLGASIGADLGGNFPNAPGIGASLSGLGGDITSGIGSLFSALNTPVGGGGLTPGVGQSAANTMNSLGGSGVPYTASDFSDPNAPAGGGGGGAGGQGQGPTFGKILEGGLGGLTGILQELQRQKSINTLQNPYKNLAQIPPSVAQNTLNTVEGQLGPAYGSAVPGLVAQSLTQTDMQDLLQIAGLNQQGNADALQGLNNFDLPSLLGLITGGLGGGYSSTSGFGSGKQPTYT